MLKIIHLNFNDKYNTNIGDQAHVLAIQETLQSLCDQAVVFDNKSIKLIGEKIVPDLWYYPGSRHYPGFMQNLYRTLIGESPRKFIRECNEADLILIGGGGIFMNIFLPFNVTLIGQFTSPLVLFGVGYNQNLHSNELTSQQNDSVRTLTNKASLVTVRDQLTVDYLKSIGSDSMLMCDPAIFLSEEGARMPSSRSRALTIGVNLAQHGWADMEQLTPKLVKAYASLIKKARSSFRARFQYFMHEAGEEHIVELFAANDVFFDRIVRTSDSRELKAAYGRVDLTVSMMLHSAILAFGAGTPCISIGYDKKNASFMALTKQSDRYISADELTGEKLYRVFYEAVKDLNSLKKDVERTKRALRSRYMDYAKQVIRIAKR